MSTGTRSDRAAVQPAKSAAKKAPPPRASLVDRAYREIKSRIMGNRYPPSLQVLEQDLALQLGMSRTPVREALIRLEKEGLVEILPRRGMRVVPIAPEDMRDIYEVLTCLEARAAERLAERRPPKAELVPLIAAVELMETSLDQDDLDTWAQADEDFHRLLLELCGNRRLATMAMTVFDLVHRARMVTLRMRPLPKKSSRDHRALIEAILAGESRRAYELHYQHRHQAMRLLTEILKRYNLQEL
ncbi:MAG: GntR family transcriptional regulator [Kiloniellales bacterium]|nr:GntR family transcriptional regulator [Kiloniellales bacterium]